MWFRRDLRVADNPALVEALAAHGHVVPLFVSDPRLVGRSGPARLWFLSGCLEELNRSLAGKLVVRSGDPVDIVPEIAAAVGARVVWCAEDFGPYGVRRDAAVADALAARGAELRRIGSPYAVPPGRLRTGLHQPYQVFTPFSKAWRNHGWDDPVGAPVLGGSLVAPVRSDGWPPRPTVRARLPEPGESAAIRALERFLAGPIGDYGEHRDRPDREGTSRLSAYLKFGCLHPRQILDRLGPGDAGQLRFQTELCWREFYADVLFHRPDSARTAYRPEWRHLAVDRGGDGRFRAWAEGRTGFPIVDAGMRQLLGEGWMHNRLRMVTASFFVKDLHLDWRLGARWFMQHLVDGDLASNQHGWQWVAGSGTDAAPYFRIFNPVAQGKRFDPHGDYVRHWVPELRVLADESVHEPWKVGGSLLAPAVDYPVPIVDHAIERHEALARYEALRRRTGRG